MEGSFGTQKEERALWSPKGQGQDKAGGNPLHLLRHLHGKRGAIGGQDRARGAFGGCLTRKLAELLWGNCILAIKKQTKNPVETTGNRYRIEILMSRMQKLKGLAVSLRVKTLNDNPYVFLRMLTAMARRHAQTSPH